MLSRILVIAAVVAALAIGFQAQAQRLSAADAAAEQPACCAAQAVCCDVPEPCCSVAPAAPRGVETVGDGFAEDSEPTQVAKPTCCAKQAYCCKLQRPCCR
ncbi:MAG: hypothetical protein KJ000_30945 [Pirellulaceae bacterium]|nr:hypothetical protein [Pirellulaceae bacterium]